MLAAFLIVYGKFFPRRLASLAAMVSAHCGGRVCAPQLRPAIWPAAAAIALFVITGCDPPLSQAPEPRPSRDNTLHIDVSYAFGTLDPTRPVTSGCNCIFPLLFSYLFVPGPDGELEPDLATAWSYDPDERAWTIHLRSDARFHTGDPVTATDVIYSLTALSEELRPALGEQVDAITRLADSAVEIRLNADDPEFPKKIWDIDIIPESGPDRFDYYKNPVGSGPFRFASRNKAEEVVLEANPDFYGGRPKLDNVVFYFEPDQDRSWTRLLAGRTDIAAEITPEHYEMIQRFEDRFHIDRYTLKYYTILLYNTYDPLFSDPSVRTALTLAIDRQAMVRDILRGYGRVATGPMGVDSPYADPDIKPLPYDPKSSIRSLIAAGWRYDSVGRYLHKDGQPFAFTLLVPRESTIKKQAARQIQLNLNDIGIKVHLEALPLDELVAKYRRNTAFQAVLTEFRGAYRNPESLEEYWSSNLGRPAAAGRFSQPDLDDLFRKSRLETKPFEKRRLIHELEELFIELQPGTFLFHQTALDVMSRRFSLPCPFTLSYQGISRLRHAIINPN